MTTTKKIRGKDDRRMKKRPINGTKIGGPSIHVLPGSLVRVMQWVYTGPKRFIYTEPMCDLGLKDSSIMEYLRKLVQWGFLIKKENEGSPDTYFNNEKKSKFRVPNKVIFNIPGSKKLTLVFGKTYDFKTLASLADSEDSKRKGTKPTDPLVEKVAKPQKDLMKLQALAAHNIQKRQSIIRAMLKQEEEDGQKLLEEFDKVMNTLTKKK